MQGLVSNDMRSLTDDTGGSPHEHAVHTSMMNIKGKMLFDMMVMKGAEGGKISMLCFVREDCFSVLPVFECTHTYKFYTLLLYN